mmetsp:Transcript_94174/g.281052  ORF Transcript_94174/g.281052 Transcript_94174/m.281052 type:complete len:96 (+) Transcript_94174:72-359(+)|eukprot:CAMPEP_0175268140 /NCGR_PEP_ID=MMETSP0093-20121207/44204_1 /TAXON_ID=311494 /ORGANISM="Alexandrium monilatum, Strain CCMP3105" /LENGTH=95 /DNA_ID=CAMNT_0016562785 /DNA_START=70 /DNA_END=357 /DNA_ORIENTATION=+
MSSQQPLRLLLALVLAACLATCAQAASVEGKSFFDVDWTDPTKAVLELVWRSLKICLALSPLIAIALVFRCTSDDPGEEELRRKKKFDFSLAGAE